MSVVIKGGLGILPFGPDVTVSDEQYAELKRRAAAAPPDTFEQTIKAGIAAELAKEAEEHEAQTDALEYERLASAYAYYFDRKSKTKELAKSTDRKYVAVNQVFTEWCELEGFKSLPAKEGILASFLDSVIRGGGSYQRIKLCVAAISYRHRLADQFDPAQFPLVKAIMLCMSRKASNGKDTDEETNHKGN